jgi:predicted nicotinamide N-methyase
MGLPLRITFKDNDYVYQIINSKLIDQYTTEFDIILNGDTVSLIKDEKRLWVQKDEIKSIDPELVHALGRSVSLRLRL